MTRQHVVFGSGPLVREVAMAACARADLLYQVERPWVVDNSQFEVPFGTRTAPHREALQRTLNWYREQSAAWHIGPQGTASAIRW